MRSLRNTLYRGWKALLFFGICAWFCMPVFAEGPDVVDTGAADAVAADTGVAVAPAEPATPAVEPVAPTVGGSDTAAEAKPITIKISAKKIRAKQLAAKIKKATAYHYSIETNATDKSRFTLRLLPRDQDPRDYYLAMSGTDDPAVKAVLGKWKSYEPAAYAKHLAKRAEEKKEATAGEEEKTPVTIKVYANDKYNEADLRFVWEKQPSFHRSVTLMDWFMKFSPILLLLFAITIVLGRLPAVELGHSKAFRRRRVMNWLPMGLTYAFLYMGRYNLKVAQSAFGDVMSLSDFSFIFLVGTVTYGLSFLINGPVTDRIGGKKAILIGGAGAALCNLGMGLMTYYGYTDNIRLTFSILYAANMYFQSFGAVAIVRVNAPWFHVNERGVFGAIFGILISLGIYFAFDWGYIIVNTFDTEWVFLVPAAILTVFWFIVFVVVRDTPGEAGFEDFDTADASSGDDGPQLAAIPVFKKMLTNPVILTIACIEFCSGFFRQAIMQYFPAFSEATNTTGSYVYQNWGLLLCCAGILGGVFAGVVSDRVFQSRRGPVAAVLYGGMLVGATIACFLLGGPGMGWMVIFLSMCVIGVHGMLSGTASMDFGGRKNAGIAVGIIDGFVYLGTGFMALLYGWLLPNKEYQDFDFGLGTFSEGIPMQASEWQIWPITLIPVAFVGMVLARRIWHAKPKAKKAAT